MRGLVSPPQSLGVEPCAPGRGAASSRSREAHRSRGACRLLAALAVPLLLCGCLEVDQYPPYADGQYDGKRDNLPEAAYSRGDRDAWVARIHERQRPQNEYNRMGVARRLEP